MINQTKYYLTKNGLHKSITIESDSEKKHFPVCLVTVKKYSFSWEFRKNHFSHIPAPEITRNTVFVVLNIYLQFLYVYLISWIVQRISMS